MWASCATEQLKWTASCLEHCIQLPSLYNTTIYFCLYAFISTALSRIMFPISLKSVCHFLCHKHIWDVTSYFFQLHLWEDSLVFWSRIKYVNNCCMDCVDFETKTLLLWLSSVFSIHTFNGLKLDLSLSNQTDVSIRPSCLLGVYCWATNAGRII